MVYGRRIVGKTFLTRGCVKHDAYFSVTSTGKAVSEGVIYGVGEAIDEIMRVPKLGGVAVIDGFQRLPPTTTTCWPP